MRRTRLAKALLVAGAILCVPGAIAAAVFVGGVADVTALRAAPICSTPTRDSSSSCLSLFDGTVLERIPGTRKGAPQVRLAVGDSVVTVAYDCSDSPRGACAGVSFAAGSHVVTGWWKGQLVALGLPDSRPSVLTDPNPAWHLLYQTLLLGLAIPGVSLVVAGLLVLQAPTSVGDLIKTALAQQPDPPRRIERWLVWRVAWGYLTWPAYVLWTFLYFGSLFFLLFPASQNGQAATYLISTFAAPFLLLALAAPAYLSNLVGTSVRRSIVVVRVDPPSVTDRRVIMVWYERPDGKMTKKDLGMNWDGHVNEGDRLDALTDRSGSIRRLLTEPPA
jgi:hypothetical protein